MTTIIRFSISGCFLFLALAVQAQTYSPSKVSKKAQEFYAQAMNRIDDGNWVSAIGLLQKANEADADFADARLTL
ncbi:MAG TPA: hypothetical protein PLR98_05650, partial [Chitinophagaceae bacterium]|nr:hypothetical protein [Chitinophagaceae bacterium]